MGNWFPRMHHAWQRPVFTPAPHAYLFPACKVRQWANLDTTAPLPFRKRNKHRIGARELIELEGGCVAVEAGEYLTVATNYSNTIRRLLKNSSQLVADYEALIRLDWEIKEERKRHDREGTKSFKKIKTIDKTLPEIRAKIIHISLVYEQFFRDSQYNLDEYMPQRKEIARRGYKAMDKLLQDIKQFKERLHPDYKTKKAQFINARQHAVDLATHYDNTFVFRNNKKTDASMGIVEEIDGVMDILNYRRTINLLDSDMAETNERVEELREKYAHAQLFKVTDTGRVVPADIELTVKPKKKKKKPMVIPSWRHRLVAKTAKLWAVKEEVNCFEVTDTGEIIKANLPSDAANLSSRSQNGDIVTPLKKYKSESDLVLIQHLKESNLNQESRSKSIPAFFLYRGPPIGRYPKEPKIKNLKEEASFGDQCRGFFDFEAEKKELEALRKLDISETPRFPIARYPPIIIRTKDKKTSAWEVPDEIGRMSPIEKDLDWQSAGIELLEKKNKESKERVHAEQLRWPEQLHSADGRQIPIDLLPKRAKKVKSVVLNIEERVVYYAPPGDDSFLNGEVFATPCQTRPSSPILYADDDVFEEDAPEKFVSITIED